ncbi:NitT/TauT family transport system substrate-binding protein [Kibdelosporangium banguiense]|uniref:NitT/TauT family transport system substrate-binding protein n=1 Tax=Kibdelosporangium banguiense TaxID=1365924 RepID=A0ABS4T9X4_9PSEU|nr:ABC transporter substrate-binding protein [Kibdelosporangium banguiense]MBP2321226.1 NitT/TauT family transport system substrate-binding protein [Kibdelosporangium banguiense]
MAASPRPRRAAAGILGAAALLAALSGCGLIGGSSDDSGGGGGAGGLERTSLKVGAMPIIDSSPVHIAAQKGYFKEEGLDVQLETVTGAATAIPKLLSGELQFTYGAYVPVFQAQEKGTGDFKFVADSYQTAEKIFVIMVGPNSTIKTPADLAGKKIATNTKNSITDLLAKSALETAGVNINDKAKPIEWVEFPFTDMGAKLAAKQIDAAVMLEPYVTQAERTHGATPILDTSQGPTKDFPISGYTGMAKFVQENPKTTEAFRRALKKASETAANRTEVEDAATKFAKIDKEVAALVRIGTFPTSLDRTRLQRTVDLMRKYGMLTKDISVDSMIVDSAKTN